MSGTTRQNKTGAVPMGNEVTPNVIEVVLGSTDNVEGTVGDKKVIWKDILSEGTIKIAPIPGNTRRLPFKVIAEGKSDPDNLIVSMSDILQAYRDKAIKYVKLPVGHPRKGDGILTNSGFAEDVRIIKKNGTHVLQGALGFTEPDIGGKVKRGTIPDVSSGLLLNYTRKADGRTFPVALHHIALTGDPIDQNLDEFKRVYADDEEITLEKDEIIVGTANFADEDDDSSENNIEVIWNENEGLAFYLQSLTESLNQKQEASDEMSAMPVARAYYDVIDIARSKNLALVNEFYNGTQKRWVIPFDEKDGVITPGPQLRWTEGKEALIAAGDEPFGKYSFNKVKSGIAIALETSFGEKGKEYKVQEASLNNQALISDPAGNIFLADFTITHEGEVFLSDTSSWEKKADAPEPKKKDTVIALFDESTPRGRVDAARSRRRKLWNTKSNKGV
jgi:hypothetical protein